MSSSSRFKYFAKVICPGVLGVTPLVSLLCVSNEVYFRNLSTMSIAVGNDMFG